MQLTFVLCKITEWREPVQPGCIWGRLGWEREVGCKEVRSSGVQHGVLGPGGRKGLWHR